MNYQFIYFIGVLKLNLINNIMTIDNLTFAFLGMLLGVFITINIWLWVEWKKRLK